MHVWTVSLICALISEAVRSAIQAAAPVPSVPERVQAVAGSCVVIPCTFTPSDAILGLWRRKVEVRMSFRTRGPFFSLRSIAFNSENKGQVSEQFKDRVSLFGTTSGGDCSLRVEQIQRNDAQGFEISLKRREDEHWGKARKFALEVLDTPEAPVISGLLSATEGQRVTLNCSVSCHCPSAPPNLHWILEKGWNDSEVQKDEVQILLSNPHRPTLLSSLSFTATHQVKPRIKCEVRHPGVRALATAKILHITFSPKDVVVQVNSLMVLEGGTALLVCSCKADPPATDYRWSYSQHGHTVHLPQRTPTVRVFNVTRDMTVRCSAKNLIGKGESRPTMLDVYYKPTILRLSSSCRMQDLDVLCRCSVDSNPTAAVTWSVNGTVPPHNYNTSVSSEPHVLTATLQGRMDEPLSVTCFVVNALGNDSLELLQPGEDTAALLWMVIPAVATCLLVSLLSLLFFFCCRYRRRTERRALSQRPAGYPEETGIYQDQMPLYINCTEVSHIYTNGSYQLVYQNSTPVFVNTKQIHPISRRWGERRREAGHVDRHAVSGVRGSGVMETAASEDTDTGIYLEIL
ncbi:sialoadhesin isoform X2 [Nelusetta ayraudi]|uniref:sialoadhesin isoform X2 n=1 Tax=Nelusetta ayraudi TaxID=303726 RepID=UPI003F72880B